MRLDWFVNQRDGSREKKELFLKMAREGKPRPKWNTKLGKCLHNYLTRSVRTYDPEFEKQLKEIRPDWFVTCYDLAKQNKVILLEMARNGDPRPSRKTKLGKALSNYLSNGNCYDAEFAAEIRKLRPDWFRKG